MRTWLLQMLWQMGSLFGRKRAVTEEDVAAQEYRSQTRQMGVTMTDRIRDAFRPKWLRIRKQD